VDEARRRADKLKDRRARKAAKQPGSKKKQSASASDELEEGFAA